MNYTNGVGKKDHLLLMNFAMDLSHPSLSHQYSVVLSLSERFKRITVLTGNHKPASLPPNVRVISLSWQQGKHFKNALRLYAKVLPLILFRKVNYIFSHMTDIHAALISPLSKIMKIRHVLWYAHTHLSWGLAFSSFFVDRILTSTEGSCPIKDKKVLCLGQAIDIDLFSMPTSRSYESLKDLIHIGRFDKSKRIDFIIESVVEIREFCPDLSLSVIGSPSNLESRLWSEEVKSLAPKWVNFAPSVPRSNVPKLLKESDVLIHAYLGSLDKILLEANLVGTPVITSNLEYLRLFGAWNKDGFCSIVDEFRCLSELTSKSLREEVLRRRDVTEREHSLNQWSGKLFCAIVGMKV